MYIKIIIGLLILVCVQFLVKIISASGEARFASLTRAKIDKLIHSRKYKNTIVEKMLYSMFRHIETHKYHDVKKGREYLYTSALGDVFQVNNIDRRRRCLTYWLIEIKRKDGFLAGVFTYKERKGIVGFWLPYKKLKIRYATSKEVRKYILLQHRRKALRIKRVYFKYNWFDRKAYGWKYFVQLEKTVKVRKSNGLFSTRYLIVNPIVKGKNEMGTDNLSRFNKKRFRYCYIAGDIDKIFKKIESTNVRDVRKFIE